MDLKLDYTLESEEDRNNLVQQIIANADPEALTPHYLEILADYIIFPTERQERKKQLREKKLLTDNRMQTVNKRETSFEGLCGKLENGEDGLYSMLSDLGKNTILTPKDPITDEDRKNIPELVELQKAIEQIQEQFKAATGKRKYLLKRQIIQMQQDQYVIRNEMRGRWGGKSAPTTKSMAKFDFSDHYYFDAEGFPHNRGILSFFEPSHLEALLCNYSALKEAAYGNFENDLYYLMEDLDNLIEATLKDDYPLYYDLLIYKIDGRTNLEIQQLLEQKHGIRHSVEYLSALWRNKIPKLLANEAENQYLIWYYTTQERGKWKKCSRCGQIKLAHNKFFSKNKSSKDGWYSLCKECRNAKSRKTLKAKSLVKND